MATTITHTVGIDISRDYTSLMGWETAQQRNLVTADEIAVAECYNDGQMDGYVRIQGWITDSNRYIKIYTPTAERHDGTPNTGFKLHYTGSADGAIDIRNANVWVQGLVISSILADSVKVDIGSGVGWLKFEANCVQGKRMDLEDVPSGVPVYVWNCSFISTTATILNIQVRADADSPIYIYNCSILIGGTTDWGIQIDPTTDVTCKNVVALYATGAKDFEYTADFNANSEYNASSQDAADIRRAPGPNSLYSLVSTDEYISPGNFDLHTPITSNLYGVGVDLSADPALAFSDDIDGDARTVWSIGCDEGTSTSLTSTFTLDTIIKETNSATFTLDTYIVSRNTDTFTIDAIVTTVTTQTLTFTLDTLIAERKTATFTADMPITDRFSASFTIDTLIAERETATFTADMPITDRFSEAFTVDAVIKHTNTNTFTIDAIITETKTDTFTIDARIVSRNTDTFTLDTIIKETKTDTFTIDAIITETKTDTFTIDARIVSRNTDTFTLDTIIKETKTATFTIDAIIKETKTTSFTIDAIVETTNTDTFTIDARIVSRNTDTFTLDAIIKETKTATFTIDAIIKETKTTSFTIDAVIFDASPYSSSVVDVDTQVLIADCTAIAYEVKQAEDPHSFQRLNWAREAKTMLILPQSSEINRHTKVGYTVAQSVGDDIEIPGGKASIPLKSEHVEVKTEPGPPQKQIGFFLPTKY